MNNKIIFTADIHWGFVNREEDLIWSLKTIEKYANQHDIEYAFILGDLFHNRLVLDITNYHLLVEFFKNSRVKWIVFPGNHDLPRRNTWEITALTTLENHISLNSNKKLRNVGIALRLISFTSNLTLTLSRAESDLCSVL